MAEIDVEKVMNDGCEHTFGLVAQTVGRAVCMTCMKTMVAWKQTAIDKLAQSCAVITAQCNAARSERDRLAGDALAAIAGAGVCTPVEGYVLMPHSLKNDIAELAKQRDEAMLQLGKARDNFSEANTKREEAEQLVISQREVLLTMKMERDAARTVAQSMDEARLIADKQSSEYHDQWRDARDETERLRNNLALISDIARASRGVQS